MIKRNSFLFSVIILIVITTICTLFLSTGNMIYQKVLVERQKYLFMDILSEFGEKFDENNFESLFKSKVLIKTDKKTSAQFFIYSGTPRQAAIKYTGAGLWGPIEILMFINLEKQTISELRILSQTETAGLGSKIEEDWFLQQFDNLNYSQKVLIVNQRSGTAGEVDAITGATKTSSSLEKIINDSIVLFESIK